MSVTADIPITSDYREVIIPPGTMDGITGMVLVNGFIYAITSSSPGKIAKISTIDLNDYTIVSFASDGAHNTATDIIYDSGTDRLYVAFATIGKLVVTSVNPSTLAMTDALNQVNGNGPGISIASDGSFLYVFQSAPGNALTLTKYQLTNFATPIAINVSAIRGADGIIHYNGYLYFVGWTVGAEATPRIYKIATSGFAITSAALVSPSMVLRLHHTAVSSGGTLYFMSEEAGSKVWQINPSTLANSLAGVPAGDYIGLTAAGANVWGLYDETQESLGQAVRIEPDGSTAVYTLNQGEGYINRILGDGSNLYVSFAGGLGAKIANYVIPSATGGSTVWAFVLGNVGQNTFGQSVAVDLDGNVWHSGSIVEQIMLTKISPDGAQLWQGLFSRGSGYAVATDTDGNVYMAGVYAGIGNFGGGPLPSALEGVFVCKFDTTGTLVWQKGYVGGNFNGALGIAVRDTGVYVTGYFTNVIDFGGAILTSPGGTNIFAVRLSAADGSTVWAKHYGSAQEGENERGLSISTDSLGNTFVGGAFIGPLDFGNGIPIGTLNVEGCVLKLDSDNGALTWAKAVTSTRTDLVNGIAPTNDGGCVVVAVSNATIQGVGTILVIRYDSAGAIVWTKTVTGEAPNFGKAIVVDAAGNIYAGGRAVGTVDFGDGITVYGQADAFVVKLTPAGRAVWAKVWGGSSIDNLNGLAVSEFNLFATGSWSGSNVDFGDGTLRNGLNGGSTFVLKLVQ